MNYALVGFGKMGREIDRVAARRGHARRGIVCAPASPQHDPDLAPATGADVAFEFTRPEAAAANVRALAAAGLPVVCGTTGWEPDADLLAWLEATGSAVVLAANFSIGVNLFLRVVEQSAALLARAEIYDPYVLEHHHRAKRDAPSGTARRLAQALVRCDPRRARVVEGNPAARLEADAIQVASVRAGQEPGRHVVGFESAQDAIVLEHRARSREGFALGAVLAAEWLGRRPGVHRFEEHLDEILEAAARNTRGMEDRP